jgi:acyl-CoA dehydrogenase
MAKKTSKLNDFIVKNYSKLLPPLRQADREALNAGTRGFEGGIFAGKLDWKSLMDLPAPKLTKAEQDFMDGPVEELCAMLNTWEINNSRKSENDLGDLPPEVWAHMMKHKFFGLEIAKKDGGHGFSTLAHRAVVQKIASRNITAAVTVMVPNSLGPAELIHKYGTDAQKKEHLPKLANGDEIPCFALTGPANGSDAAGSMQDEAIVIKDPETGELSLKMNWSKRYITLSPVTDVAGITVKVKDPDSLLGGEEDLGITAVLVPRETDGAEFGRRHAPTGLPFMNGPTTGKDVVLPIEKYVIGGKEGVGRGWIMVMECLGIGRCISLPSLSTSGAKLATQATTAYASFREQFNTAVSDFQGIEEIIARMGSRTYMMDAMGKATALMIDRGEKPVILSAISKYHLTENLRKTVDDGMDVMAGAAVQTGPKNIFNDGYIGMPVAITVEGSNPMTRNLLIFGQGLVTSHPHLKDHMEAASDGNGKGVVKHVVKHALNAKWNIVKSFVMGFTDGRMTHVPVKNKKVKRYYQKLNRMASNFNVYTNMSLLIYGGGLKTKERVSARLGDIQSHIAMAAFTLWKFEKDGSPKADLPIVERALQESLHEAEKAMADLNENYAGGPLMRGFMNLITKPMSFMPFTGRYNNKMPKDKLDHKVTQAITVPGDVRNRLTDGIYKPSELTEQLGLLEDTFNKYAEAKPIEKKIYKAVKAAIKAGDITKGDIAADKGLAYAIEKGIITKDEAKIVKASRESVWKAIQVDEFESTDPRKNVMEARKMLKR